MINQVLNINHRSSTIRRIPLRRISMLTLTLIYVNNKTRRNFRITHNRLTLRVHNRYKRRQINSNQRSRTSNINTISMRITNRLIKGMIRLTRHKLSFNARVNQSMTNIISRRQGNTWKRPYHFNCITRTSRNFTPLQMLN